MVVGQGGMAITEVAVLHVAGEWNIYIGFVIIHIQLMVARTVTDSRQRLVRAKQSHVQVTII